jgi:elongator complex protein 1
VCVEIATPDGSLSSTVFVGLASSGKLYFTCTGSVTSKTLFKNVLSFVVSSDFVITTTSAHEASFVPLSSLVGSSDEMEIKAETRKIERGSRIVTAVSSTMSLILQMPRGNLETIYPRPLVLKVVKQDLTA